jgi:trimeric autotransporter adhesin
MNAKKNFALVGVSLCGLFVAANCVLAQGTAFSYNGQFNDDGNPANGTYDLNFTLYDASTSGTELGSVATNATIVSNGLFTVTLDFGAIFNGSNRWLEIAARTNGNGAFTTLSPRQQILATPYAVFANIASNLSGSLPAAQLTGTVPSTVFSGTYARPVEFDNSGNSFSGAFTGNGAGVSNVNAATVGGVSAGGFWRTNGNAGTSPADGSFLGTTDDQPLELHVNGQLALRLEPNANGANVIAGSAQVEGAGSYGVAIAGGNANTVNGLYAFVGGGQGNSASANFAVVGGGSDNTNSGGAATVGGGEHNVASGLEATIAGGSLNSAINTYATVAGGNGNTASGIGSFTGGGEANSILSDADYAFIGGGKGNTIISGDFATLGGGYFNTNGGVGATVSGGEYNIASADNATVGGGWENVASAPGAFVGGGGYDGLSYAGNTASGGAATVGGGLFNYATNTYSTVGGGTDNSATGPGAFVGGGGYDGVNFAGNTASGGAATVGGGANNFATGLHATIPGGMNNLAAGSGSFAAGQDAYANYDGSFVWGDGTREADSPGTNTFTALATGGVFFYTSADTNGGQYGATLAPNSTSWGAISDKNAKKNFAPVDGEAILERLTTVPIEHWNYKWEKDSDQPNIGPMAQDFKQAFYPGRNDKIITTLEFDGVELAAIQGLNQKVEELKSAAKQKDAEIQRLKQQDDLLAQRLSELEQAVHSLGHKQ